MVSNPQVGFPVIIDADNTFNLVCNKRPSIIASYLSAFVHLLRAYLLTDTTHDGRLPGPFWTLIVLAENRELIDN